MSASNQKILTSGGATSRGRAAALRRKHVLARMKNIETLREKNLVLSLANVPIKFERLRPPKAALRQRTQNAANPF